MVFRIMISKRTSLFCLFCILLSSFINFYCNSDEIEGETILEDFLVCRSCGNDIALTNFLTNKLSPVSLVAANETLFGKEKVLVQILENPVGIRFEVIVLKRATCARISVWSKQYTWFPGYAWKLCLCPKCSTQLGFMFEPIETANENQIFPSEKGFYVIIIDKIIAEKEVKSFLMNNYIGAVE